MKYTERQIGWVIILPILALIGFQVVLFTNQWGENPLNLSSLVIISLILMVCLLLFFQMKTTVDNEKIQILFGIGLIKKIIYIRNVKEVSIVTNKWYNGLGIKIINNGWMYNIQGLNAIELKLKNTKSIIRIGTADSEKLKQAVETKMQLFNL